MALQLTITDSKGISAEYHRIISATQNYINGERGIYINLAGYVSRAYRELELLPQDDENYQKSTVAINSAIFLKFVDGDDFEIGNLYKRIKLDISELSFAKDQ
jgi:hypothetical protein